MTKRIFALILAAILCLSFVQIVSAAPDIDFIIDEQDSISAEDEDILNKEAASVYDSIGVAVFYVFTYEENFLNYDLAGLVGDIENYVVMIENTELWYIFKSGIAENCISVEDEDTLRAVYVETEGYKDGISAFFATTEKHIAKKLDENNGTDAETQAPVITYGDVYTPAGDKKRLYDGADVLTDDEEKSLLEKLDRISDEYKVDVAVATVNGIGDMSADDYTVYYYENSGLGFGDERDGVLLLLEMEERNIRIRSNGKELGAAALSQTDLESMIESLTPALSDGNYAEAFNEYADSCEYEINGFINGFPFEAGKSFIISLIIGLIVAFIVTGNLKGQLKSVRSKTQAADYVNKGSLAIFDSRDTFLYSRVTCKEKPKKDSSSSSSGSSSNMAGGKF